MHCNGWLPPGYEDQSVAQAAAQAQVDVSPLSLYCQQERKRPALLLGYTAVQKEEMDIGFHQN